jgi:hypothetical protein
VRGDLAASGVPEVLLHGRTVATQIVRDLARDLGDGLIQKQMEFTLEHSHAFPLHGFMPVTEGVS